MSFDDVAARLRKHSDKRTDRDAMPRNFEELYLLRARILGVLIRDARQAADISLEQCAAHIDVPADTLLDWELGKAMPGLPEVELLAYVLNVPISHFWGTETLMQQAQRHAIDAGEYVALRNRLIGALLRAAREEIRLTPEQLAAQAGVSPANITAYEMGQRAIPTPVLTTLASACQVNMSYFLENANRVGEFLALQEELKTFSDLPPAMRRFVASPVNQPYIELAMKLAQMGTSELRSIAESILDITL